MKMPPGFGHAREEREQQEKEKKRREEEKRRQEQKSDSNSDWPIKNLNSGVKELIKLDLSTEEGIGKAINLVEPLKFSDPELEPEVMAVASQARLVQQFMDKAKDGQNKLRSSLVELLIPSRL